MPAFISLGFLVIQFLVNGFGTSAIAPYTGASKVDAFAEMPAINLGQALMNFTAQNEGAGKQKRITKGGKSALITTLLISIAISVLIYSFAPHFIILFNHSKTIVRIDKIICGLFPFSTLFWRHAGTKWFVIRLWEIFAAINCFYHHFLFS